MIAKAQGKFLRLTPPKVRQVLDIIRYKDARAAEAILININKRPKEILVKLLRQAIANASVKGFSAEQLYVSKAVCNVGPTWKRFKAAAFGRAAPIKKRTSHVKIELDIKSQSSSEIKGPKKEEHGTKS